MEVWAGPVLIRGPGSLAINGKGALPQDLPGRWTPASESVPVLKLWLCSILWFCKTLALDAAGGQSSLLCACFGFISCSFGLLSLKGISASRERG